MGDSRIARKRAITGKIIKRRNIFGGIGVPDCPRYVCTNINGIANFLCLKFVYSSNGPSGRPVPTF